VRFNIQLTEEETDYIAFYLAAAKGVKKTFNDFVQDAVRSTIVGMKLINDVENLFQAARYKTKGKNFQRSKRI
jgi:hypothetical protein